MKLSRYLRTKGAAAELARATRIPAPLISLWGNGHRHVPAEKCIAIEIATVGEVSCEEMRPDIPWHYLRGTAKKAA